MNSNGSLDNACLAKILIVTDKGDRYHQNIAQTVSNEFLDGIKEYAMSEIVYGFDYKQIEHFDLRQYAFVIVCVTQTGIGSVDFDERLDLFVDQLIMHNFNVVLAFDNFNKFGFIYRNFYPQLSYEYHLSDSNRKAVKDEILENYLTPLISRVAYWASNYDNVEHNGVNNYTAARAFARGIGVHLNETKALNLFDSLLPTYPVAVVNEVLRIMFKRFEENGQYIENLVDRYAVSLLKLNAANANELYQQAYVRLLIGHVYYEMVYYGESKPDIFEGIIYAIKNSNFDQYYQDLYKYTGMILTLINNGLDCTYDLYVEGEEGVYGMLNDAVDFINKYEYRLRKSKLGNYYMAYVLASKTFFEDNYLCDTDLTDLTSKSECGHKFYDLLETYPEILNGNDADNLIAYGVKSYMEFLDNDQDRRFHDNCAQFILNHAIDAFKVGRFDFTTLNVYFATIAGIWNENSDQRYFKDHFANVYLDNISIAIKIFNALNICKDFPLNCLRQACRCFKRVILNKQHENKINEIKERLTGLVENNSYKNEEFVGKMKDIIAIFE